MFSQDLTIDASNTTIFLGQDIDFSCDEALFTEWDMGDQTTYTDVYEFTHLYQEVGTYNVTLQYDNGPCGTGQEQVVITVLPNDLTIVASDPSPCEYDTLTLSSYCPYEPAVQQWQWHYQGNVVGNQQNLNWFLATDDPQTLTLTTYDADNNVLDQTQYTISGLI